MFLFSRLLGKISVAKLTVTLSLIISYSTATLLLYINNWIIIMSVSIRDIGAYVKHEEKKKHLSSEAPRQDTNMNV